MGNLTTITTLVITSGAISLLCLLLLHFLSPEFKPSWRMVSEYALGKHKWLLTSFFIFWSISNMSAAYFYAHIISTTWAAALSAILVLTSGIGALMGRALWYKTQIAWPIVCPWGSYIPNWRVINLISLKWTEQLVASKKCNTGFGV